MPLPNNVNHMFSNVVQPIWTHMFCFNIAFHITKVCNSLLLLSMDFLTSQKIKITESIPVDDPPPLTEMTPHLALALCPSHPFACPPLHAL